MRLLTIATLTSATLVAAQADPKSETLVSVISQLSLGNLVLPKTGSLYSSVLSAAQSGLTDFLTGYVNNASGSSAYGSLVSQYESVLVAFGGTAPAQVSATATATATAGSATATATATAGSATATATASLNPTTQTNLSSISASASSALSSAASRASSMASSASSAAKSSASSSSSAGGADMVVGSGLSAFGAGLLGLAALL